MLAITPDERYVLRREADWYADTVSDLGGEVRRGTSDLTLRWQTHIALALLDDLGWQHEDPRPEFFLTLPTAELTNWLRRTVVENDKHIADMGDDLADAHDTVLSWDIAHGATSASVAEMVADRRESTMSCLDEALELRLVATRLLERLTAGAEA